MKRKFKFDDYEVRIIVRALVELRNELIDGGRYTDAVDELIKNFANRAMNIV
ncbi:MAG: hypothetical protein Q4C17_02555 [Bacillota bacterium]|nr:hypothetical protein [Bacillota bacterium]